MREVKADIKNVYQVHSIENDFRREVGLPLLTEKDYMLWTRFLFDERREYLLLFHGKQSVGMIWGHLNDWDEFVVEGRYLKPRFRSWKFKKGLTRSWLSFKKRFDTIKMRVPVDGKTRHRPLYREVLLQKRG